MIIKDMSRLEDLTLVQRSVSPEMVIQIRQEVNKFVAATGKDDLESIMFFLINVVGQDAYNQGVLDVIKEIRAQNFTSNAS